MNKANLSQWSGFGMLVEREIYRFGRLVLQTVVPSIITTILYILIFGYSLGRGIREIEGFSYILYILPGLAIMGVITSSFSNTSTSLFVAKNDRSIENLLISPISSTKIVLGFVIGGLVRGLSVGVATLGAAALMVHIPIYSFFGLLLFMAVVSIAFASMGLISALWAETWDQMSIFLTFVITPAIYLGGVFYSIHMLPDFWYGLSHVNPIFYIVDGFRFVVLGVSDISPIISLGVVLGLAVFAFSLAVYLFRKGYHLTV